MTAPGPRHPVERAGSDGGLESPCRNVFTDIWDAYYAFPGDLMGH